VNKLNKITTLEIENRVAQYFNPRQNIVVPNISWGMNIHECDLLIVRKSEKTEILYNKFLLKFKESKVNSNVEPILK